MKSITAIIDPTGTSERVIEFSKQIAQQKGAMAQLIKVVPEEDNSRHVIALAEKFKPRVIRITAQLTGDTKVFGQVDKENIKLNDLELPVLCFH